MMNRYWDDASVLLETDASGNIRALNTIVNEIISRKHYAYPPGASNRGQKYYYLYDHLGNTRALTDEQGNLVQESESTPSRHWSSTKAVPKVESPRHLS